MLLLLPLACSPEFADVDGVQIATLTVTPGDLTLETGPNGPVEQQFLAVAELMNGEVVTLETVEWGLSNASAGEIDADGLFSASTTNGGVTWIRARFDGIEAIANVTLIYADQRNDDGVDTSLFDQPETTGQALWTYPSDNVNFPRNTPGINFQWIAAGQTAARLRFRSSVTDISIYTTGTSYTADEATWASIAGTNAGGTVTVDLSLAAEGSVLTADPLTLNVNRMDGQGSIYYWSTSAQGIMKVPYGGSATDYLSVSNTGHCVGCHVARGDYLAYTYDGGNGGTGMSRLSDGSTILGYNTDIYANFKTFSPDGKYLLGTYNGALLLYDGQTGAYLYEVATGYLATHVDWSPDGSQVALVLADGLSCDWSFSGGKVAVMDVVGDGQFGTITVLYDPPDPTIAYYPAWSPDGAWIAFNQSTQDAYDDSDATLYVINGEGGTPVPLTNANYMADLTNSWPHWGPLPDDDVLWLAFSSKRAYGNVVSGAPQIWVVGFDPALAEQGLDPTWPAFWLPGQDPAQSNHIPVWTRE
ncbi:MAG: hypothetical protein EXR69_09360 [Myxococcales bacterium]|nr:hypothetical protein [Myxococcales bacterium]